ncbi:HEPN domain-containing protein [Hymenobacter arizonensis]|uniref:HEPN domain-containing protein n=1 Tax=Hymenobacter arizonensis TaxID=1227077 RepID=A0A1I6AD71_HYMAR|nr:HEPN domain-containing protein [Hymenobacter arizonensis]SFQ66676.1 HEPN domain-containing protein [Hymenobacter arizonensis]
MQQPSSPAQTKVATFLRTADRDLETAETLAQHSPHLYESIGFSCQQATEKYLKAALFRYGLPAPFIHDLTSLASGLASKVHFDQDDVSAATILNSFAVKWRYESDDAPDFTVAELLAMAYRFQNKLRPLAAAFIL